ncbi:MAG: hypothetical protein J1E57_11545 [Prevotella sp.]|nr:hypothetical protein [Prevotella sp.]
MKYLLTMICLLAALTSCHKDDDVKTPQGRTVLVYMSAENTLNDFSDVNIKQMIEGSKTLDSRNHLIVFVDKATTSEMPYIAEIANGELKKVKEYSEDFYASDPNEMREIIKWTATNYPAEDYGLVLWGHASGWIIEDSVSTSPYLAGPKKAFGVDNGKNNPGSDIGKWLNIPSMAQCIAESGIKFKYIFADVCCFQCVENVYELRNATDWLIGSPAEIPGYGAPYNAILPYLFSTSPDFYKGIIDEYEKYYNPSYSVPLAATKTSEAASLAQAANQIWGKMPMNDISADGCIYYFAKYYIAGKGNDSNKIFYDAYDIVRANTDAATAEAWSGALDRMIAYSSYDTSKEWMTASHVTFSDFTLSADRMKCLSMFVPLTIYNNGNGQYNEMIKSMAWYYASGLCNYMN